MKIVNKSYLITLLILPALILLTGCQEVNSRMEEQLDNLNQRAEELDSAVNKGLDKVENLDSTITARTERIKDLDSLVRKTTARIDSIVTKSTDEVTRQLE